MEGIIKATEKLTGYAIEHAYVESSHRDHKRKTTSLLHPVIGHMQTDGHLGRRHLKGRRPASPGYEYDRGNYVLGLLGNLIDDAR
ncbi:hypothetical protein ACVWXN_007159 [Bradyrhizobium sp. i1.4.4]|uniref:hypothetical protein n=1 Tax=unclassified Bradyrhizobium TaxID=2631580 RepID=UPI0033972258